MQVSVDGISFHYEVAGAGEPVVLLHGSGPGVSAKANWWRTIPALAEQGFRVVAPDVVGLGDSDMPENFPCGPRGWAQSLRGSLSALDLGPVHLLGKLEPSRVRYRVGCPASGRSRVSCV